MSYLATRYVLVLLLQSSVILGWLYVAVLTSKGYNSLVWLHVLLVRQHVCP